MNQSNICCTTFLLASKSVKSLSLTFHSIYNVHRSDRITPSMLSIRDRITDDISQVDLAYTTCFFVDETRDTFDTTTSC